MPCFKTLTMSAAVLGEAPLQDAVYVSSVNKIFGVSGVHLLQFNASTGVREAQVRISSPVYGTCRLCYHAPSDRIYASVWNEANLNNFSLVHPNKSIRPINPATLAVGSPLFQPGQAPWINALQTDFNSFRETVWGPAWLGSSGNYLYVQWMQNLHHFAVFWINPANITDVGLRTYSTPTAAIEQIALTPTEIFIPGPFDNSVYFGPLHWVNTFGFDYCDMGFNPIVDIPIACEYSDFDGLVYAVDGNGMMFRINDPTTDDFTRISLTTSIDPVPGSLTPVADACRLRASPMEFGSLLYLPCMSRNSILIYNQTTEKSAEITGFENPVDVVFVPAPISKAWAVQNSPEVSLKEIV